MKRPLTHKIRVVVVDDSIVSRAWISNALTTDPSFEIVAVATNARLAWEIVQGQSPQLLILNVDSPQLDGLALLEKVMKRFPTRTLAVGGTSGNASGVAQKALSLGAVDVISPADFLPGQKLPEDTLGLLGRIHSAARGRLQMSFSGKQHVRLPNVILAIAASTGGPDALQLVLSKLPANIPPTLVVQHMPAFFTRGFAKRLNAECAFEVREAREGDALQDGVALIAPGDFHMTVEKSFDRYRVSLNQAPLLHGVRPAADPLFESVARHFGSRAIGVVLTGMGRDGANGLLQMRKAGSFNIAQDQESSVVFGMPREAIAGGAVQIVSPLGKIASVIMAEVARRTVAKVG
ncbi:chemotaxis-specific protein-glutamate methyltransferase CheB [bacterium]|nr:chemotaxis-specific protein-glutamate methyltransferase CheB [bacterium]